MIDEPCSQCTNQAVRTIAALAYCHRCAETFLEPIRARHIAVDEGPIGSGRQNGRLRPDWGERWAELQCSICNATWVGPIGEPCTWCIHRHEAIIDDQREAVLHPNFPDPEHPDHGRQVSVWAARLAHAVKAGIVDVAEAERALRREEIRHVA